MGMWSRHVGVCYLKFHFSMFGQSLVRASNGQFFFLEKCMHGRSMMKHGHFIFICDFVPKIPKAWTGNWMRSERLNFCIFMDICCKAYGCVSILILLTLPKIACKCCTVTFPPLWLDSRAMSCLCNFQFVSTS